jgi:pimeloyl-ACP methyl ester carboxylesterase
MMFQATTSAFDAKEECIEFRNPTGEVLRGILHTGAKEGARSASIICLNTGLNDMVGWHRLQVKVARFLAGNGYNVLRFDNAGIGDSEGEIGESSIVRIFSSIETGLWKEEARASVDFMADRFGDRLYYYLGFCGGGLTGIFAAVGDARVNGVINIAAPITLSSDEYMEKTDPWTVKKQAQSYARKIFSLKSIYTFVSGKSDYSEIYRSISNFLKHKWSGKYDEKVSREEGEEAIHNFNHRFYEAFLEYMKQQRPALFYYAENDAAAWELKKHFLGKVQSLRSVDRLFRYEEVQGANHIFSGVASQEKMKTDILEWLRRSTVR